jgi:ABC-type dipeptide/oligopeptide/nickel transport system ATPase component
MHLKVTLKEIQLKLPVKQLQVLKGINFLLPSKKIYCILGENGSGKSTLIKSLTGLLPKNQYQVDGEVIFNNIDLLSASQAVLLHIRKNEIRYVFQDSINSFDPVKKLGYYFDFPTYKKEEIKNLLAYFLLPDFEKISQMFPFELSGGMAQRLTFVLALAANPELLILDEPTSGIDYTLANLTFLKLKEFVQQNKNSVLLVTQDWNFATKISDYISLLFDKSLSEFLSTEEFLKQNSVSHSTLINEYRKLDQ